MAPASDNHAPKHLRHIRAEIVELREDVREVKGRLTAVELARPAVRRELAHLAEADACLSARVDRVSHRVARAERQLDLGEPA